MFQSLEDRLKGKLGSVWSDSKLNWDSKASDALKGVSGKDFSLVGGTADNPQPSSILNKFLDTVLGNTFAPDNQNLSPEDRFDAQVGLMGETIRGTLNDIADKAIPILNGVSDDWTDKERKIATPAPGETADDTHTLNIGLRDLPSGGVVSSTQLTLSNTKGGPNGKEESRTTIGVKVYQGSVPAGAKGQTKNLGVGQTQKPVTNIKDYLASLTAEERAQLEAEADKLRTRENAKEWLNMEMAETKQIFGLKDDEVLAVQKAIDDAAIEAEATGSDKKLGTILNALTVMSNFKSSAPSFVPEEVLKYSREDANIQSLYSILLRKEREGHEAYAKEKAEAKTEAEKAAQAASAGTFGRQPGSTLDEGMKAGIYGRYSGGVPMATRSQYTTEEEATLALGKFLSDLDTWWRGK